MSQDYNQHFTPAALIVRDICELEELQSNCKEVLIVSVEDLQLIVERHTAHLTNIVSKRDAVLEEAAQVCELRTQRDLKTLPEAVVIYSGQHAAAIRLLKSAS